MPQFWKARKKKTCTQNWPALVRNGEDVGFLDGLGGDIALRLDEGEGAEAVAEQGGALEIEVLGGLVHVLGEVILHGLGLAGEELAGLIDELVVVGDRDFAGAGAGAALDLVEHAGPGAGLVEAVRAGAEEEGALQRGDGALDRQRGSEGAEIVALGAADAAMLLELGGFVLGGDEDVGEALVVAQQHVEAGLQALDQVGFEQEGFGLASRCARTPCCGWASIIRRMRISRPSGRV